MKIVFSDQLWLDLDPGPLDTTDLRGCSKAELDARAAVLHARVGDGSTLQQQHAAAVFLAIKAMLHDHDLPEPVLAAFARLQARGLIPGVLVETVIGGFDVAMLERVARFRFAADPATLAHALRVAEGLPEPARDQWLLELAGDPRPDVRAHFLELACRHETWMPPGSLKPLLPVELSIRIARDRLRDPSAAVRARAIALVYGLGRVADVRTEVMALASDPELDVRQYALVALGTLDDHQTLRLLAEKLQHGSEEETTSAIWALARRADGIEHVLPLAADRRPWVSANVLGAIAYVSAPLSDAQLATIRASVTDPDADTLLAHHRWRTREGGHEVGPRAAMFKRATGA